MAFKSFLIFGFILLLNSCAQIGTLTGGSKDVFAPKPLENSSQPLNGSTNYQGNSIVLVFDEYVKLNNPTENILIVPPHTTINSSLHKRTVTLNWKDTLEENTTYTVYLNRAIEDITEGNDSLMQFVFSTGNTIDSLTYKMKVIDAFTNAPVSNCLVGLYSERTDSVLPTYFSLTDKNGWAKFNYLKHGSYTLRGFEDKNKDLMYQKTERIALRSSKIQLDSSLVDSNFIRLFTPQLPAAISSIKYIPPSLFEAEFNRSIENAEFKVNDKLLNKSSYSIISKNKISFLSSVKDSSVHSIELSVSNKEMKDTISLRILDKEKMGKLIVSNNLINNTLTEIDTLKISFSDFVNAIDPSQFSLQNKKDSSIVRIEKIEKHQNNISIFFNKKGLKDLKLVGNPTSLTFDNSTLKDTLKFDFSIREEKEFGAINLDASAYKKAIIIEVLSGEKVIKSIYFSAGGKKLIEHLEPGEYTFRVLIDENNDGEWTTGNVDSNTLPEEIQLFLEPTKVRANWEIDLKLIPKVKYE